MSVNGAIRQNFNKSQLKPTGLVAQRDNPGFRRHAAWCRYAVASVAIFAVVLALIPWYSQELQNKSLRQAEQGFQVEALHTAQSASAWNPLSVNALMVLAGAQHRVGYDTDAKTSLQKAVRMQPLNYEVWEQLAIYERDYWHMPQEAHQHFVKASSLNPYDAVLRQEAGLPPLDSPAGG
ncbi:MAG: hypothetical protein M0Z32_04080 [Actinomycetota bacterium]|jgi:tetratricopeptide (TPR) repeat protein|nr:hypothetical protein [Actinomycetota bacterium]MCL6093623.1 hypothetical protein [Actinomycetota bacterium]MDA8166918.1 hypothetical protein [Actinomycetota bacterium]